MKKTIVIFILAATSAISINLLAQNVVKVNNALDFLNAIDSNTVIELEPGTYNISQVMDVLDNPRLSLVDNFDGFQPNVTGVNNLTIKGGGAATILLEPRYAWVMMFIECRGIVLEGITFGHTEAGYCMGGVLGFESCYNVNITNCSLYGSGTVGIMASKCTNFSVKNSDIYECTYGLTYIYNSQNVNFVNTKFRNTGEFNLVEIMDSHEVSFVKCSFTDNFTSEFMPHLFSVDENLWSGYAESEDEKSSAILLSKCKFKNNQIASFVNNDENVKLKGCKFSNNSFDIK